MDSTASARADRFRPISELLRPRAAPPPPPERAEPPAYSPLVAVAEPEAEPHAGEELAHDVRRFRARLADALEAQMRRLLPELVRRVLGRERAAAPADLARLANEVVASQAARGPVRVRVAPGDAGRLHLDLPVLVDPSLEAGDLAIDVRDGSIDFSYASRVAVFLDAQGFA